MRRVARPLLAAVFVGQGVEALRRPQQAAQTARPVLDGLERLPESVSAKVPSDVETLARINAVVQISAGALLASGRLPRVSAAALACTVVPGRLGAHRFWSEPDPQLRAEQRREFLTDVSLIGGLMIAAGDTEGKPSLGWRARRAARRAYQAAATALPGTSSETVLETVGDKLESGLHAGAERGRELAERAGEQAGPLLEAAGERGMELAGVAAERGMELAEAAAERGTELAHATRDRATALVGTARRRVEQRRERAGR